MISDTLIQHIQALFAHDSVQLEKILEILNRQEQNELMQKFGVIAAGSSFEPEQTDDIKLKADTIDALIAVISNSPGLEEKLQNNIENGNKDVLKTLFEFAFETYRSYYLNYRFNSVIEQTSIIVVTSLYGILCDKVTHVDLFIEDHLGDLHLDSFQAERSSIEKLEFNTLFLILCIIKRVKNIGEESRLNQLMQNTDKILAQIQDSGTEDLGLTSSLKIAALANLLYLLNCVKKYLFTGASDENIATIIESYTFNTVKLLKGKTDSSLLQVAQLAKSALKQLCRNSVWELARNPWIKRYFEKALQRNSFVYSLLPSQRDSILSILTLKKSILLNMPTSAGKSLLAELYILFTIQNYTDPEDDSSKPTVCYVVPTNALINQVQKKLTKEFIDFKFRIETVLPFSEVDAIEEEILRREHIDILISTPEKLEFLVRDDHPSIRNLKLIVLDEAHNLEDQSRGSKFELLLSTVKLKRPEVGYFLQSPFIDNYKEIADWLGGTAEDSVPIHLEWSPSKQYIGCHLIDSKKTKSSIEYFPFARNNIVKDSIEIDLGINPQLLKKETEEDKLNDVVRNIILLNKYLTIGGTILILMKGPGSAETLVKKITKYYADTGRLEDISSNAEIQKAMSLIRLDSGEGHPLIETLKYGVAFHHARLSFLVKEEIENLVINGHIKILLATTTLAQGMNFPISTVIFETLKVGGGKNTREITKTEFWNIAGRAGRAYMDPEGHIILKFQGSEKKTRETTKTYIKKDIKDIVSTLESFFDKVEGDIKFDYDLVKDNSAARNFLQYLNHVLRVSYKYKFDEIDTTKIRNILNASLFFKQSEFKTGFIETQEKVRNFAVQYMEHLKSQKKETISRADSLGITDISLNSVYGRVKGLENDLISEFGEDRYKAFFLASSVVMRSDNHALGRIVDIIHRIPELKLEMESAGRFQPEQVAKVINGWVNGKSIRQIAESVRYDYKSVEEARDMCQKFINSDLRTFAPWGMAIYQNLTDDEKTEDAKHLPSYVYYGVNDKESVILSKMGIPRFVVSRIRDLYQRDFPGKEITIEQMEEIKGHVKSLDANDLSMGQESGKRVKEIIEAYI